MCKVNAVRPQVIRKQQVLILQRYFQFLNLFVTKG